MARSQPGTLPEFDAAKFASDLEEMVAKHGREKVRGELGVSRTALNKYLHADISAPGADVLIRAARLGVQVRGLETKLPASRRIETYLRNELGELGASSAVLYYPDSFWEDFRLVAMPGVEIKEPMYGFLSPSRFIIEGAAEEYVADAASFRRRREDVAAIPSTIPQDRRRLFGDFGERERVKSFARLIHRNESGEVDAILFVNFSEPQTFAEPQKRAIRAVLNGLVKDLPDIAEELGRDDAIALAQTPMILQPDEDESAAMCEGVYADEKRLNGQLTRIIKRTLAALGLNAEALGTIHLYNARTRTLELRAHWGDIENLERSREQSVVAGDGVISCAFIRKRAILIPDLPKSRFNENIHVEITKGIHSELVVPMIVDGEVVGTLNLEAKRENAFTAASVRPIWYAANSAAALYRSYQEHSSMQKLLRLVSRATTNKTGIRTCLNELSALLCEVFEAFSCDIFSYNAKLARFDHAGASYSPFEAAARYDGWNVYIKDHCIPVWLSNISGEREYVVRLWRENRWCVPSTAEPLPLSINSKLLDTNIRCALGLPICTDDGIVGVTWIKSRRDLNPPSGALMRMSGQWARQIGLTLQILDTQGEHEMDKPDWEEVRRISTHLKEEFFGTGSLKFPPAIGLEGFIAQHCVDSRVSGTFRVIRPVSDAAVGMLLGDGQYNGVTGLLNALPLITMFEAYAGGSESSRHVMDKLVSLSSRLGLHGTALYSVFKIIERKLWVSITCAGRPSLIYIRPIPLTTGIFPSEKSTASGSTLGHPASFPLSEAQLELAPGDLLISCTAGLLDVLTMREVLKIALDSTLDNPEEIAKGILRAAQSHRGLDSEQAVAVVRVS